MSAPEKSSQIITSNVKCSPLSCIKEGVKRVSFKLSTPKSVLEMWYDLMFNEDDFYFLCSANWIFSPSHHNDKSQFLRQSCLNTFLWLIHAFPTFFQRNSMCSDIPKSNFISSRETRPPGYRLDQKIKGRIWEQSI